MFVACTCRRHCQALVVSTLVWHAFWFLTNGFGFPAFTLHKAGSKDLVQSWQWELAEQSYIYAWLPRDAVVANFGGNIGTSCIFVDKIITNPSSQLCIEVVPKLVSVLNQNAQETDSRFAILDKMVARPPGEPLPFTYRGVGSPFTKFSRDEVPSFYFVPADLDLSNFTALWLDCGGCFCYLMNHFPEMLDINFMFIQEDIECKGTGWEKKLSQHGYVRVDGSWPTDGKPHKSVWLKRKTSWFPWTLVSHFIQISLFTLRVGVFERILPAPLQPGLKSLPLLLIMAVTSLACWALLALHAFYIILCEGGLLSSNRRDDYEIVSTGVPETSKGLEPAWIGVTGGHGSTPLE